MRKARVGAFFGHVGGNEGRGGRCGRGGRGTWQCSEVLPMWWCDVLPLWL